MKVFDNQTGSLKVGHKVKDFPIDIDKDLSLSNVKGSPIFLVFWKTI